MEVRGRAQTPSKRETPGELYSPLRLICNFIRCVPNQPGIEPIHKIIVYRRGGSVMIDSSGFCPYRILRFTSKISGKVRFVTICTLASSTSIFK